MKLFSLILTALVLSHGLANAFDWRGASVYFVITDRFANGNPDNDCNYGRINDYGSDRLNAATFHGGDLQGLLDKARSGWFDDLGIDVVWMTDVYEQIHGWQPGSGSAVNDFPHYGYHGYYPLDYTQMDKNYGTIEEMRLLVDTLHAKGIRVMLGANINDPGYPTLLDAVQLGFAPVDGMSETAAACHHPQWDYEKWASGMGAWPDWWSAAWLRTPDEDWSQTDKLTMTLYGLPDFKDESTQNVSIPTFLKRKWDMEGNANDAWVNPSARNLRTDRDATPIDYITDWIASWVEEFGIDGMRCDIVEYVHPAGWKMLSDKCNAALGRWRARHPEQEASQWTDKFYMTGDFDEADIDYKDDYAGLGFSSMVNFYFPKHGDLDAIVYTWQAYSDSMQCHADWHPFSYLNNSYHRDTDMSNLIDCATTLLLAPGTIQIFYGDETNRPLCRGAMLNVDSDQAFRSDMDWDSIDMAVLSHFRKLGKIRQSHRVIGSGRQTTLDVHTALRHDDRDSILISLAPAFPIKSPWPDGSKVTDLYTSHTAIVKDGVICLPDPADNVAVIRRE